MSKIDIASWVVNVVVLACLILLGALILGTMTGCNTFKVVNVPGQPDECNDFYTTLNFYAEQAKGKGGGDSAFIGTVYNECRAARTEQRKALREKHCQELIYGKDSTIIKEDYKRYTHYLECSK